MPETAQASRGKQAKARIRQAFTKLLREKPIQRIAVKELCQEAGVNRSTFYAHYQDIYDLLTKIEEDMLEDFQRALAPLLEPGPEAISPLEITRGIYRCLQENADVCTVTLGEFGDKDFALCLLNIGRESCLLAYSRQFPQASPQRLEYFYAFASGGNMELLRRWVQEGMATPAEDMARAAEAIMFHGMEFLKGEPLPPGEEEHAMSPAPAGGEERKDVPT